MPQLLSVSRAARLVGVSRAALQIRIRNNELPTFEGQVALTDLLRVYPDTQVQDNRMLERVERIKAHARPGRRDRETGGLPMPEVLAERLNLVSHDLVQTKSLLRHYTDCAQALKQKLKDLIAARGEDLHGELEALLHWVENEMEQRPQDQDARARLLMRDTFLRVMSAHVTVIPSGHDFFVEGNDSLLQASLSAGLRFNYGCSNGNCGSCKARVVSGQVHKLRDTEYRFSDNELNLNYILMCSCTAVTDLVLEASEASSVDDLPHQVILAKIDKALYINPDIRILHVRTPRTKTLRFMAGQNVTLEVDGIKGEYPIASCPCDGGHLEFHIRRDASKPLSERLFETLSPNHMTTVTGPFGDFVLVEEAQEAALLLAWEDGFAPIKSLLEHAVSIDNAEGLRLYWFSATDTGHYMENQCRAWSDAIDNFHYTLVEMPDAAALQGELEERFPLNLPADIQIYIAGPAFFVDAASAFVTGKGIEAARVHRGYV